MKLKSKIYFKINRILNFRFEIFRSFKSIALRIYIWNNSKRGSASRQSLAASASLILSPDGEKILVVDNRAMANRWNLAHHELVFHANMFVYSLFLMLLLCLIFDLS